MNRQGQFVEGLDLARQAAVLPLDSVSWCDDTGPGMAEITTMQLIIRPKASSGRRAAMQRHTKEASELKALILADLHKEPGCEHVTDFAIQRLETRENGANWTVKYLDPNQDKVCETILINIARMLQLNFDLPERGS
jgi:hypothetical protein